MRRLTALDAARPTAIKRNVHEWLIGCDAAAFIQAYAAVLVEPGAVFAGLRLRRQPGRTGAPFAVGERFQSVFVRLPFARDVAEIDALDLERPPYRARYRYVEGGPMAGASTFIVAPEADGRCRFTAIFEFQELGLLGVTLLHRFGIRAHDRVVAAQVARAAERLGAPVLSTSYRRDHLRELTRVPPP